MFKKFSLVLVSALLAVGVVFLPACKDDDDSSADGKAAARDICNCFKALEAAVKDLDEEDEDAFEAALDALEKCAEDVEKKYSKYVDIEDEKHPFVVAFEAELKKCNLEFLDLDDLW